MAKNNIIASVHQRLLNQARASQRPFMELLQYYAMERFLYRMSKSIHAENYILKGALLLKALGVNTARPTKDIDLLGLVTEEVTVLENVIRSCCNIGVEDDGLLFDPKSVRGEDIRENQEYQGIRIKFKASLGNAIVTMQIDIGFGDVVSPTPVFVEYPVLLEGSAPKLLAYTLESAIAEKFQAMVALDLANSRMKDFYDIWFLSANYKFTGHTLATAIDKTFRRRNTPLPSELPTAFSENFSADSAKNNQWKSYREKIGDVSSPEDLKEVVNLINDFIWPINKLLVNGERITQDWSPGTGWK